MLKSHQIKALCGSSLDAVQYQLSGWTAPNCTVPTISKEISPFLSLELQNQTLVTNAPFSLHMLHTSDIDPFIQLKIMFTVQFTGFCCCC